MSTNNTRASGYGVNSPINLAVPEQPSDLPAEDQRKFFGVYSSLHTIVAAMRDYLGVGSWSTQHVEGLNLGDTCYAGQGNRVFFTAGEEIAAGRLVEIRSDGLCYQATGATVCGMMIGKQVSAGETAEVMMFFGIIKNTSGLTAGARYFLGAGGALASSGTIAVGRALSSSVFFLNIPS